MITEHEENKLTAVHSFVVFPQDLNYAGSLFGGKVLSEIKFGRLAI